MKRTVSLVVGASLLLNLPLVGCSNKMEHSIVENHYDSDSIMKLKEKYKYAENDTIMPLYNVSKEQDFKFTFRYDVGVNSNEVVTVHTDKKCLEDSLVSWGTGIYDKTNNKTEISVKPPEDFMVLPISKDTQEKEKTKKRLWGSAPVYYIRVNYDLNSDTVKKLDKPLIIPFTVKSDVEVPNLKYEVNEDGIFKLKWNKVNGATAYRVYQTSNVMKFNSNNEPIENSESGYAGTVPISKGEVRETEFKNFMSAGNDAMAIIAGNNGDVVSYQNMGVSGEYFVTAIKDGKESNFSNGVSITKLGLKLPTTIKENIAFIPYNDINSLPKEATVEFTDGTNEKRRLIYDTVNLKDTILGKQMYFKVEGTSLRYYLTVKLKDGDLDKLEGMNVKENDVVFRDVINNIGQYPGDIVKAVNVENKEGNSDSEVDLIQEQIKNTMKLLDDANREKVPSPDIASKVKVNANSAIEEYVALSILDGRDRISLKAFPSYQNKSDLERVISNVLLNNPIICGINSIGYDYGDKCITVDFADKDKDLKIKQEKILSEASKILTSINIKSDSKDEVKSKLIYEYLRDKVEYDGMVYSDVYDTLVNKLGNSISIAKTYKLLCDLSNINNNVVSGTLNKRQYHMWNKVRIGDKDVYVDVTSKKTNRKGEVYGVEKDIDKKYGLYINK